MPTHIWVIEIYFANEWEFKDAFPRREVARRYLRAANFLPGCARIRKYVPA